ncbi:MAG: DUF3127 domain-containing protein [Saprospiraceae bacterium]|nr:DUF3127 domain-containing protein [Saprospiraceae bacterium]
MSYEVVGALHKVFDSENKTSTFQTREFVLSVMDGNYPQYVKFQLVQDRCAVIDNFKEGEQIKVFFDLRGREWQGKYFTNLQAWKVDPVGQKQEQSTSSDNMPDYKHTTIDDSSFDNDDLLPF